MNPHRVVLLVEDMEARSDANRGSNRTARKKGLGFELRPIKDVRAAYWEFVQLGSDCLAAIIDLQLQKDSLGNYDGIDLALAFSHLPIGPGRERPRLIGYTAESSSEVLGAFNVLRPDAPNILALLRKDDPSCLPKMIYKALEEGDRAWFERHDITQPVASQEPKVEFQWVASGAGIVRIDANGWIRFAEDSDRLVPGDTLLREVCRKVFSSYSEIHVKPLPQPGYSGALVLRIKAYRMSASRSRTRGKQFLVKIRPASPACPSLRAEAYNFLTHAVKIKENSPLLFGYFELDLEGERYEYIVYELINFLSNQIWSFHNQFDKVDEARKRKEPAEERLQTVIFEQDSYQYARALFQALTGWHGERLQGSPRVDAYYPQAHLEKVGEKIVLKQFFQGFHLSDDAFPLHRLGIPGNLCLPNAFKVAEGIIAGNNLKVSLSHSTIHGDLHSMNVLRQQPPPNHPAVNPHWMIIDFEDVCPGPIAMDVATMECDLKFRCIDEDFRGNTSERYKLELELAEHLVPTRGILAIRQAIDRQGGAPLPPSLRLLVVQLLQLRKAAFDQNWTFRTRQALMELSTALMFHSLQHCLWAESPLHFYPIWFAACLAAAGLVESKTLDYSWSA